MNKIKINGIFYDLDNTLYPQIIDVRQRIEYCINKYLGENNEHIKEFWVNEWLDNGPNKYNIIDDIIQKFLHNISKENLITAYRNYQTKLYMEEGILNMLNRFKKLGIKQFIITNGDPKIQLNKINSLEIKNIFDEIIIATSEYAKPSTHWYRKLLERYNSIAEKFLSIGDWYAMDGVASISAGIRFIKVNGGPIKESVPKEIQCINKLTEIERYINYEP